MARQIALVASPAVTPLVRPLGVVVVDPLPVVRAGLSLLIGEDSGMEVLAEAGTADEGLDAIGRLRRGRVVVLVGLGLGGDHDAYWLIRSVRERYPSHAILGCGANADPSDISRALFVGADGFVDKNIDPNDFLRSLGRAANHEIVLEGPPLDSLSVIADGFDRRRDVDLSPTHREREVLIIAAEGLTAREIGDRLGVRERTITTHLARIYRKLGVGSRLAAIRLATRSGLVSVAAVE